VGVDLALADIELYVLKTEWVRHSLGVDLALADIELYVSKGEWVRHSLLTYKR
jgi:hypothetical protein